ncbi:cell wall hydrolase [Sphingobium sp. AS12]|uniref:cell wall hydrolase n=1 Tax=Sphingobium sp. AS12 TaxID=2849495 RepID=UPI001C31CA46|nr:cell wall hydrolase [Sphingobium sp. AS12]MBV2149766.1 cell wall hydrolase [Sphingobium sp. AS12]
MLRSRRLWTATAAVLLLLVLGGGLFLAKRHGYAYTGASPNLASQEKSMEQSHLPPPEADNVVYTDLPRETARRINAKVPFSTAPNPAAPSFEFSGSQVDRARALDCLAAAAFYEAGDDPVGQKSVIQVVLNRVRHPVFPTTICGVVFQGSERSTGCQFTFTCNGAMAHTPSADAWGRARKLAAQAMDGSVDQRVGEATHYHTDWVVPLWSAEMDKIVEVNTHLFFRWRGSWGRKAAWRRTVGGAPEPFILKLAGISAIHNAKPELSDAVETKLAYLRLDGDDGAGTREASTVKGNRVHRVSKSGRAFFMDMTVGQEAGSYAIAAWEICKGKAACVVIGWMDGIGSLSTVGAMLNNAAFYYYHQTNAGKDLILWDCGVFRREDASQCLPADMSKLNSILAMLQ